MRVVLYFVAFWIIGYFVVLTTAHTKDHFVLGDDYYWHGKKIATQPEDCTASRFDTESGKVTFFGCGHNNKILVFKPSSDGASVNQQIFDSQMKPMNDAIKSGKL